MHQSWSRAEAEWRQKRQSGGRWGWRWLEVGGEGEGRSYHDMKHIDMILSHVIQHDMLLQHMGLFICLRQNLLEFDLGFLPLPELITKMLSSLGIVKMGTAPQLKSFWSECQGTQRSLEHHWEVKFELIIDLGSLSGGWTHTMVSQFHQQFNGWHGTRRG